MRIPGRRYAGLATLALASLWHCAPALASSNNTAACGTVAEATLLAPSKDLKKAVAAAEVDAIRVEAPSDAAEKRSPPRLLSPGIEASVPDEYSLLPSASADEDSRPLMNARVPGVSDEALTRYKRQMYRKDI